MFDEVIWCDCDWFLILSHVFAPLSLIHGSTLEQEGALSSSGYSHTAKMI